MGVDFEKPVLFVLGDADRFRYLYNKLIDIDYDKGVFMLEINEIKDALADIAGVTDIKDHVKGIAFQFRTVPAVLITYNKDAITSAKIEIMNSFKAPENYMSDIKNGYEVAEYMNITTESPCKIIFIKGVDSGDGYIFRNVFSDKLEVFSEDRPYSKSRKDNIKLLILRMLLENFVCFQNLKDSLGKMEAVEEE